MRDVFAALAALLLLVVAASLATTLQAFRRRRQRARDSERALGRTIIAEIPAGDDLVLFSEDATRFYYGEPLDRQGPDRRGPRADQRRADRRLRVAPASKAADRQATSFEDRPDGIARDRWDVAIETVAGTTLVECGADSRARVAGAGARGLRGGETRRGAADGI